MYHLSHAVLLQCVLVSNKAGKVSFPHTSEPDMVRCDMMCRVPLGRVTGISMVVRETGKRMSMLDVMVRFACTVRRRHEIKWKQCQHDAVHAERQRGGPRTLLQSAWNR